MTTEVTTETTESVLVVLPTYNERENLPHVVAGVRRTLPLAHILVVDDSSPDGTGALADALARNDPKIHVLHRLEKDGLGRAYTAGFFWGLARPYSVFVQMDADLSHDPAALSSLLSALETADVVLGSRYVSGGGIHRWDFVRRFLSFAGNLYARCLLSLPYGDLTGGYKAWRRQSLIAVLGGVTAQGYVFQVEMTLNAHRSGCRIVEHPILFTERTQGLSKISLRIVWEAAISVWRLRAAARSKPPLVLETLHLVALSPSKSDSGP